MLVITRKVGERVRIGDDIVVVITKMHGSEVRIGFEAPREVEIHREEVWQANRRRKGDEGG